MFNTTFWLLCFILCSIPWINDKPFGLYGTWFSITKKPLWLIFLESFVLYVLIWLVMLYIEYQQGQTATQGWQFYAVALCFWFVLSFPAIAWFKLRKR